jgi:hypothetical protein
MAAFAMVPHLNSMLEGSDDAAYAAALSALAGADTVRDAVEAVGVLDRLEDHEVAEALAVLDALPPSIDEAIMAALENALERNARARIEWEEADRIELRITEEPEGNVRIVFVCPDGSTFL